MSVKVINPSDMFHIAEFGTAASVVSADRKWLINHDELKAFKANCPHHGYPLVEDHKKTVIDHKSKLVTCPLHGLKVSYETGHIAGHSNCMSHRDLYSSGNSLLTDQKLPPEVLEYLPSNVTRYVSHNIVDYDFGWDKFMHVFEDNWHPAIYHEQYKYAKFGWSYLRDWGCITHFRLANDTPVFWISVYPNLTFEIYPDAKVVEISRIEHIGENKSRHHLTTYRDPALSIKHVTDHMRASLVVYEEDKYLAARIQRPSFFHPIYEASLEHFYKWLDNYVPRSNSE